MDQQIIINGVLMDEETVVSAIEVCQRLQISEDILIELVEYGVCVPRVKQKPKNNLYFDQRTLTKIETACRLQRDLGINTPGIAVVLELLDELEQLRNELNILQRHVNEL